ncbi:MAG: PEGA domain-containing protein [Deltaproteobacteria bacterium]|nr:PEGA domain-containing protein [Deltaproteobacteria bacterium]
MTSLVLVAAWLTATQPLPMVGPRRPLGVLASDAPEAAATLKALERKISETLDAEVLWIEPSVPGCGVSASCWVAAARGASDRGPPRLLVVTSTAGALASLLIDPTLAPPSTGNDPRLLASVGVDEASVLSALERSGFRRTGELALRVPVGAVVSIDGARLGEARTGQLLLRVAEGSHDLVVSKDGYLDLKTNLSITAGKHNELAPELVSHGVAASRAVAVAGGITVAFVGLATMALTIASTNDALKVYCINARPATSDCAGAPTWRTIESVLRGPPDTPFEDPNEGSVYAFPLGLSAILGGATWAIWTASSSEEQPGWLPMVVGTVGGIAIYGVLAATRP